MTARALSAAAQLTITLQASVNEASLLSWRRFSEFHNAIRPSSGAKIMASGILIGVTVMMVAFAGVVIFGRKRGLL